jgi:hypothetical protein
MNLRLLAGGLIVSCSIAAGCNYSIDPDYGALGLVDVSGSISLDGAPVANAVVIFEAPDLTFSFGRTDEQGRYELMFNSEKSGVLQGEKTVRIRTSGGVGDEGESSEDSPEAPSDEKVPACYNSQSKIKVTITSDSSTLNFELKSDCSTVGPT